MIGLPDKLAALYFKIIAVAANITLEIKTHAEARLYGWFGDFDKREISESNSS